MRPTWTSSQVCFFSLDSWRLRLSWTGHYCIHPGINQFDAVNGPPYGAAQTCGQAGDIPALVTEDVGRRHALCVGAAKNDPVRCDAQTRRKRSSVIVPARYLWL